MQFTSMWNITGTRIHLNTRGSEPWAQGSLIPGANYSAQVIKCCMTTQRLLFPLCQCTKRRSGLSCKHKWISEVRVRLQAMRVRVYMWTYLLVSIV